MQDKVYRIYNWGINSNDIKTCLELIFHELGNYIVFKLISKLIFSLVVL